MAVLPVLAACHAVFAPAVHPLLTPDSPGYMYFTAGRPIGYPALLWVMSHLGEHYDAVRPVQIVIYCASCWWLGFAARLYAGSWASALLLQAALLFYPPPLQQADQMMADLPSSAVAILFAATLLRLAAAPSVLRFCILACLAGLGITLRPDGLALAMATLPALALLPGGAMRRRAAAWGIFAMAVLIAATPAAQRLDGTGADQGTRLARGLIQKVMFLPTLPQSDTCDARAIDAETADLVNYWRQAPPAFQDVLRLRISNLLRYNVIIPAMAARHHAAGTRDVEPVLLCYTKLRARAQPFAILREAVTEYRNLVLNYTFVGPDWHHAYVAYLHDHPPPLPVLLREEDQALWQRAVADTGGHGAEMAALEHAQDAGLLAPPPRNMLAVAVVDGMQATACLASLLFLIAFCMDRARAVPCVVPGAVIGMALQLHLLAIAALEIAQPRYLFPAWPLMMTDVFLGACVLLRFWVRVVLQRKIGGQSLAPKPPAMICLSE
jgi:hypothetical protein